MASVYFPAFFSQSTVFLAPLIIAIVAVIAVKVAVSTNWYKRIFAKIETKCQSLSKDVFAPLKRKIFADLSKRLKEVNGDVLEIGIGAGENFLYYPHGTSLIAVDPNPHVETLLRENLEKIGDRVHLKKFVVASAEDMNCTSGEFGVKDNSVAAAVGTFLLCSLTDDQTTKTLQEVKRVLLPVSNLLHDCILFFPPFFFFFFFFFIDCSQLREACGKAALFLHIYLSFPSKF